MRVLSIDVGTSSVKAGLTEDRVVTHVVTVEHTTQHPRPGRIEQHPDHWWNGVKQAISRLRVVNEADPHSIDAISVTGQMQDLIRVHNDAVLLPAILYSDTRADQEHEALVAQLGLAWANAVGAQPDATNLAAKWVWVRNHAGISPNDDHLLFGAHSDVVRRMTGRSVCDHTTAATTGLFDIDSRTWWAPVLQAAGIADEQLPNLVSGAQVVGALSDGAAAEIGWPVVAGVPVIHAPGDAVATTLGIVGAQTNQPYAYVGTSGWVGVIVTARPSTPGVITLPTQRMDRWLAVIPMMSAGASIDWARTNLLGDVSFDAFDQIATDHCAAAEGLLFLPDLNGTRASPAANGVLVGLRPTTTPGAVAAAAFEGVARELLAASTTLGLSPTTLPLCGGSVESDVFCQVVSDVFGVRTTRPDVAHASLIGAADCAAAALQQLLIPHDFNSETSSGALLSSTTQTERSSFDPNPNRTQVHRRFNPVAASVAGALHPLWSELTPQSVHQLDHSPTA
jgi:xylulokinase